MIFRLLSLLLVPPLTGSRFQIFFYYGGGTACCLLLFPFLISAASVSTDDTFLGRQWYLDSISTRDGWNVTTGSRDVIVAVLDGVMDITHEDLQQNIWANQGEIAGNGKDDDGNGYADDLHGWNFVTNSPDVEPRMSVNGSDEAWMHATAVASIIAAAGNNDIGISGVAWRVRIMPLVVLDETGTGGDQQVMRAIRYAVANGADIINLSVFGAEHDETLAWTIREATAQGVLIVSAAGNGAFPGGRNLTLEPGFPACAHGIRGRGTLTVTALDRKCKRRPRELWIMCGCVRARRESFCRASYTRFTNVQVDGRLRRWSDGHVDCGTVRERACGVVEVHSSIVARTGACAPHHRHGGIR